MSGRALGTGFGQTTYSAKPFDLALPVSSPHQTRFGSATIPALIAGLLCHIVVRFRCWFIHHKVDDSTLTKYTAVDGGNVS